MSDVTTPEKTPGRLGRLYQGLTTIDFVGRKKTWFTISTIIIVLGLGSLAIRGFNLGIDFKGGSSWTVLAKNSSVSSMTSAVERAGLSNPTVEKLGSSTYQVTDDINNLPTGQQAIVTTKVVNAMANPLVKAISHPGNPIFPIDQEAIVAAAHRTVTALEMNNTSFSISRKGSRPLLEE